MSQRITFLVILGTSGLVAGALPLGCGGDSQGVTAPLPVNIDGSAGTSHTGGDGGANGLADGGTSSVEPGDGASQTNTDAATDGAQPAALIRLADWAADAPTGGLDLCVMLHGGTPMGAGDASSGGTWVGPLVGTGIGYPNVSAYTKVAPGIYDARVVATGDRGCASAAGTPITLPVLGDGARTTVALVGAISPSGNDQPAEILAFADDTSAPAGRSAVRFIDALTGVTAVVFGTGKESSLSFAPLTGNVTFGAVGAPAAGGGAADANGYLSLQPTTGTTFSAHVADGETDVSTGTSTSLVDGGFVYNPGANNLFGPGRDIATGSNAAWSAASAVTVVLLNGNGGGAPELSICNDLAPAQGPLSACSVLSP